MTGVCLNPWILAVSDELSLRSIFMSGSWILKDSVSILIWLNWDVNGTRSATKVTTPTCPALRLMGSALCSTGGWSPGTCCDVRNCRLTITPRDGCGKFNDSISSTGFFDIGSNFCFHEKCNSRSIFMESIGVRRGPFNTQNFCLTG